MTYIISASKLGEKMVSVQLSWYVVRHVWELYRLDFPYVPEAVFIRLEEMRPKIYECDAWEHLRKPKLY